MHCTLPPLTTPAKLNPSTNAASPLPAPALRCFEVLAFLQQQQWVVTRYALAQTDLLLPLPNTRRCTYACPCCQALAFGIPAAAGVAH